MKMLNKVKITAFLCALSFLITGCSIPKFGGQQGSQSAELQQGQKTIEDRTLRLGVYHFDTYHPLASRSKSVKAASGIVYEPLYTTAGDGRAVPILAQGFVLAGGGKEIRVKLKDGVSWHDGSALTVRDVVYSAGLAAADETGSYQNIESAYAIDDSTVGIRFKRAIPNAAAVLTFPVVKNNSAKNAGNDYIPMGTGPYRYRVRDSVNSDIFEPFDGYHGEQPAFEKVKIYLLNSPEELMNMFYVGEVDALPEEITQIDTFSIKNNSVIEEYTGNVMTYLGVNFRNRIFWGAKTRRALANVIDQESIGHALYNKVEAVNIPMNPRSWIAGGMDANTGKSLEQAEILMAQDGWKRGSNGMFYRHLSDGEQIFSVKLLVNQDDPEQVNAAKTIESALKTFGIACVLDERAGEDYHTSIQNRDYDIFIGDVDLGINMDYGQITPSGDNVFTYVDKEMDQILLQMNTLSDDMQLKELYARYCQKIAQDVPYIPLFFKKAVFVHSPKINISGRGYFNTVLYDIGGWSLN